MSRRCEECWAILDPAKVLRCTKCKACFYCSAACQKRNWRLHKRVCSTDPELRPFIPVEMAVERAVAKQPKVQAPKEARCYICLEGDRKSSKLMRGCACRGDSAGFVHLECLTELAVSKEAGSGDFKAYTYCINCHQGFNGALALQMERLAWRRHRSSSNPALRYTSTTLLIHHLGACGEIDVANHLNNEASKIVGSDENFFVDLDGRLNKADIMTRNGQKVEALELLRSLLPEAKAATGMPMLYVKAGMNICAVLGELGQYQECFDQAAEGVEFTTASFGPLDHHTLNFRNLHATACGFLGRIDESKALFNDLLAIETRVLGRDQNLTQNTLQWMRVFGFVEPTTL